MVKVKEQIEEIKNIKIELKNKLSPKRRYDLGRKLIRLEREMREYEQLQKN